MVKRMKIGIQGIKGSFHHIAAEHYFGKNIDLVECDTFGQMPNLLKEKKVDVLVMAIENSIAGAILPNYALIDACELNICGESYLPIRHNLMALKGQKIAEIREVHSHPMALLQCQKFLKTLPHIKIVEDIDTAYVAKKIKEEKIKGVAAIASTLASKLYELEILASNIQTININATRFFILNTSLNFTPEQADKASVKFITKNESGSLAEVLGILSRYDLNLSKIQSLPIINTPWKYAFFVDFSFNNLTNYKEAIEEIKEKGVRLKILGLYTKSKS